MKTTEGQMNMVSGEGEPEGELKVKSKKSNKLKSLFNPFECIMYLVFLIVFTVLVVEGAGPNGDASYYCSETIREPLTQKEFDDGRQVFSISSITDVWNWLDVVFLPTLIQQGQTRECVAEGVGCATAHSSVFDTLAKRDAGTASKSCVEDDAQLAGDGSIVPSELENLDGCPGEDGFISNPQDVNMVQLNNRLLGGIRLKMQRVTSDACPFNVLRSDPPGALVCADDENCTPGVFTECYPEYKQSLENKAPLEGYRPDIFTYGRALQLYDNTDHTWQSVNERDGEPAGKIVYTEREDTNDQVMYISRIKSYGGGGYVVQLPGDYVTARSVLLELRRRSFLDRSSRSLILDWNTYNPNVNLHTTGRVIFEFPSSGSVNVEVEIKTWNLLRYVGTSGTVIKILEYIYFLFVLFFTIYEFYEIYEDGKRAGKLSQCFCIHFSMSGWHYLDVVNLVFYYVTIIWHFYIDTAYENVITNGGFINTENYVSFRQLTYLQITFNYVAAVNGMLLWLKLFKYFHKLPQLSWFVRLLGRAGPEIGFFLICLFIILIAFGMVGTLVFSSDMNDFRNLPYSFSNLLRFSVTADMNYEDIVKSNRSVGSLFYIGFNLIMYIIILNVLIAILSEAYMTVKVEIDEKVGRNEGTTFRAILRRIFTLGKDTDLNKDGYVDRNELGDALQKQGGNAQDADIMMAQYDADGDGRLDANEMANLNRTESQRGKSPPRSSPFRGAGAGSPPRQGSEAVRIMKS